MKWTNIKSVLTPKYLIKEGLTNPMEGPSVTNDDWANLNSNLKDQVQLLKSKVGIKENRKEYDVSGNYAKA